MKYNRILLKLSGEALGGEKGFGIDYDTLSVFINEILEISKMGVQVGIVIGGGNIFRGLKGATKGFNRVKGDYMGMLATVINAIALQSELIESGAKARVLTSTFMEPFAERYTKDRAEEALGKNEIVIFAGGTGNPFFSTDSGAALRGVEINADVLLKGTNVDGVYTADPKLDKSATKFSKISFDEVMQKQLKVMDLTAFTLCYENKLPIIVFKMSDSGTLKRIVMGEALGTVVS